MPESEGKTAKPASLCYPSVLRPLKEKIDETTRLAELRLSLEGILDEALILQIARMEIDLERLYKAWLAGKLV